MGKGKGWEKRRIRWRKQSQSSERSSHGHEQWQKEFSRAPFYWNCGPRASSIGLTWEFVRNAEAQASPQTLWIRMHSLTRFPTRVLHPLHLLMLFSSAEGWANSNQQEGAGALWLSLTLSGRFPNKMSGAQDVSLPLALWSGQSFSRPSQAGGSEGFLEIFVWIQSKRSRGTRQWCGCLSFPAETGKELGLSLRHAWRQPACWAPWRLPLQFLGPSLSPSHGDPLACALLSGPSSQAHETERRAKGLWPSSWPPRSLTWRPKTTWGAQSFPAQQGPELWPSWDSSCSTALLHQPTRRVRKMREVVGCKTRKCRLWGPTGECLSHENRVSLCSVLPVVRAQLLF